MTALHRTFLPLLLSLTAMAALPASAQMLKDSALDSLYSAQKFDELLRVSTQRLGAQPDDAQAVLGLALAVLSRDDEAGRQAAIRRAEVCIGSQPKAAACHYALGAVLGVQALSEGMLRAARSAGTVREALSTAHALEPAWYLARGALVEFYVQAPGMMGGSFSKAAELARTAPTPEQARLLEARVAMLDRKFDVAVLAFAALPAQLPPELVGDARSWAVQCVLMMVNAGQASQAQPLAERSLRDHAGFAGPAYGLARVRGEAGAHEDALKLYERALTAKGAGDWPLDWRIGVEQQALGRNEAAKVALNRYVSAGKGQKASLEDARKRLQQLGG